MSIHSSGMKLLRKVRLLCNYPYLPHLQFLLMEMPLLTMLNRSFRLSHSDFSNLKRSFSPSWFTTRRSDNNSQLLQHLAAQYNFQHLRTEPNLTHLCSTSFVRPKETTSDPLTILGLTSNLQRLFLNKHRSSSVLMQRAPTAASGASICLIRSIDLENPATGALHEVGYRWRRSSCDRCSRRCIRGHSNHEQCHGRYLLVVRAIGRSEWPITAKGC